MNQTNQMDERFSALRDKTVLVTGATGFTGSVVTRKLVAAGAKVRAIARPSSNLKPFKDLDIEWFTGDVFDPQTVAQATPGVHYIFHLAAAFREEKSTDDDFRKVHLTSTQLLAESVLGSAEFSRFVHVSTVGVHGHIESGRADENYRFAPGDGYQRTKLEGEQWIAEFGQTHHLPFTIIRPAPIFGPGDLRLLKIFRMVNKGYLLMLGKGKGLYHLVHVEDLANTILLSAVSDRALGEAFISASDDPISIEEMGKLIAGFLGKRVRVIRLPLGPFYLAADFCAAVFPRLGLQPPIYRRRVDFYTKDRSFDNTKIRELLDYEFLYDNESGIEQTTRWYLEEGLLS